MGYANAFQDYWQSGWRGILPLQARTKYPPPTGYTGYDGATPGFADCMAWAEEYPDGNLGLRLPRGIIGIDVDAYAGKTGGATLAHAESLWGELPSTWRSTSRDDTDSGIRLFRVPEHEALETVLGFPDRGIGHIEIIQFSHRYCVAYPSIHPEGRQYVWRHDDMWCPGDEDGFDVPPIDDIPELPEAWLDALRRKVVVTTVTADVRERLAAMPPGNPDDVVTQRCNQAITEIQGATGSRHDTTLGHVLALLGMAAAGRPGVPLALRALETVWLATMTPERGAESAQTEWDRMVWGQRGHDLIASNPPLNPAVEEAELRWLNGSGEDSAPLTPEATETFWGTRATLTAIRQHAYARMCSPWAVLGAVMCRALALVPPHVTLPPTIGGRGSLNLFVALVGPPGAGKGAAAKAAAELFPGPIGLDDEIYVSAAGSAEGIAHQYMHRDKKDLVWVRKAVMFFVPEIDTLVAIGARTGSTLMPALRMAYSGEDLGYSYADSTKRLPMPDHSYRLTYLMGVQPDHAEPLFADASGGFPQRCIWLPSQDSGITETPPEPAMPLDHLPGNVWAGSIRERTLQVPDEATLTIRRAHVQRMNGSGDALDGHALFTRLKVAAALAVIERHTEVTMSDWELAGIVMRKSDETREAIRSVLNENVAESTRRAGVAQGFKQVAAQQVEDAEMLRRIGKRIVAYIDKHGPTRGRVLRQNVCQSDQRHMVNEALESLAIAGTIVEHESLWQRPELDYD